MCQYFDAAGRAKKTASPLLSLPQQFFLHFNSLFTSRKQSISKRFVLSNSDHPQPPESQEPELQPPPPFIGLVEVIPKPERGPASTKSTVIPPHVVSRLSSTRNFNVSFSKTLSFSFGSSRAKPRDGPAQPPCIRAIRSAESILFCCMYSFSLSTAKSVTLNSDMKCLLRNIDH